MSIQTEIARIAQAKTDIKNVVNSKVANTITNQTIDAFPPLIDSSIAAYKNLIPWIEGSGSSFAIDNAEAGKLDKFEMYGNTHQDSYTGKNLINNALSSGTKNGITYVVNDDKSVTLKSGTATATTWLILNSSITLEAGTYTMSQEYSNNDVRMYCGALSGYVSNGVRTQTINETKTSDISINIPNGTVISSPITLYPMIEKSSTKTSYEPYTGGVASPNPDYPQDIEVVTGNNTINVHGKNLLKMPLENGSLSGITWTINENGSITLNGTSTNHVNINSQNINMPVVVGETYTISTTNWPVGNIGFKEIDGTDIWVLTANSLTKTKTITSDMKIQNIRFAIYIPPNKTLDNVTITFQLEKGSTASEYTPYVTPQEYPINLGVENLFDKDNTTILNAYIDTNIIDTSAKAKTTYIPCKPNTTYTIQKRNDGNNNRFTIATTTVLPAINVSVSQYNNNNSASTMTITTNSTANYLCLTFYHTDETTLTQQQVLDSIQIEKGSKASPYTPYGTTPIELCKIGSYQDEIRKSTGKNLFDKNNANIINAYLDSNTSKIVSNNANRTFYINCEENTTYTISKMQTSTFSVAYTKVLPQDNVEIFGFNSTATTLSDGRKTITITTGSGANYIVCRFMQTAQDTATLSQILSTIMVEKSSSATSYEPYGKVWYKHSEIGKVVLDGSEDWTRRTFPDNSYLSIKMTLNVGTDGGFCNYFISNNNYDVVKEHMTISKQWEQLCFAILKSRLSTGDEAGFRNWLSTNTPIAYYILETPTNEEITDTTLISQLNAIETYTGTNTFSVSNSNDVLPDLYVLTEKQNSYKNWKTREGIN